jgi:hypothetical protein
MFRADNVFFKLAGLALLVAFVAALTPQASFGQKPPILAAPLDVNVVNTPVPVTGTLEVSGAIAATQSGEWTVGITGPAAVTSGDQTVLIDSFAGDIDPGFNEVAFGNNIAAFKTVRVHTNCFLGASCASILVRVYTVVGGRSYLVEEFPMPNFVAGTRVYDVIGTNVTVQLVNNTGAVATNIGAAVFGRAN